MAKLLKASRPLFSSSRPPPKQTLDGAEWAHKDGTSVGNSSQTIKKVLQQEGVWGKKAISGWRPILGFTGAQSLSAKNETHCSRNCAATMKTRQRSCQHAKDLASDTLLPPTEDVEWAWRKKKNCELVEILEIAAQRKLSTLSTRNRAKHLEGKASKFRKTGERGTKKAEKPGAALQRNRKYKSYWRGKQSCWRKKKKCEARSKRLFPTHKQKRSSLGAFWATEKQCFVRELFWKAHHHSQKTGKMQ